MWKSHLLQLSVFGWCREAETHSTRGTGSTNGNNKKNKLVRNLALQSSYQMPQVLFFLIYVCLAVHCNSKNVFVQTLKCLHEYGCRSKCVLMQLRYVPAFTFHLVPCKLCIAPIKCPLMKHRVSKTQ